MFALFWSSRRGEDDRSAYVDVSRRRMATLMKAWLSCQGQPSFVPASRPALNL
jgi:hypothetical protein